MNKKLVAVSVLVVSGIGLLAMSSGLWDLLEQPQAISPQARQEICQAMLATTSADAQTIISSEATNTEVLGVLAMFPDSEAHRALETANTDTRLKTAIAKAANVEATADVKKVCSTKTNSRRRFTKEGATAKVVTPREQKTS